MCTLGRGVFMLCFMVFLILVGCGRSEYDCIDCVKIHERTKPAQWNPLNINEPSATTTFQYLFQTLIHLDFKTNELIPVLAKKRPRFVAKKNGKMELTFEIRAAAVWDNGMPITGKDVAFTFKLLKCPNTNVGVIKTYFEKVESIQIDKKNPRKFKVIYSEINALVESDFTELYILPAYIYDKDSVLSNYKFSQFIQQADELAVATDLIEFAQQYNELAFQMKAAQGSGPYQLMSQNADERIILKLKSDWWGHQYARVNHWFQATMPEIVIEFIESERTMLRALRKEEIDAAHSIPYPVFAKSLTKKEGSFLSKYDTFTAPLFAYDYIGINLKSPKLELSNVRKALAHLMNVEELIEQYCYGLGTRVTGFTHPSITKRIAQNVVPYVYDLVIADSLLTLAGWIDKDSDGIREKFIDSTEQPFSLSIRYNIDNQRHRRACQIFKKNARRLGIEIDIVAEDRTSLLDNLKKGDYELYVLGWISGPYEIDPRPFWHSSAKVGGLNYVGFGNEASDVVIEQIGLELVEARRAKLYQQLHEMIHNEVPYIFLLAQQERIAIHKKFGNRYSSGILPGYWVPGFTFK